MGIKHDDVKATGQKGFASEWNKNHVIDGDIVVLDHGAAATDMVINVCYGTSATPPLANTTTEGAVYIRYAA